MTPSSSSRRRRSSSQPVETRIVNPTDGLAALVTMILVAGIVLGAPLVLGAARLWFELPVLCVVALLLALQGLRLTSRPPVGVLRKIDAIDICVLLFVVYAVIRWLTSPTEFFSRLEIINIVAYAGMFFTCRYGLTPRPLGVALLIGLVALGVFETWFGYYLSHHLTWFPFGDSERLQLHYAPRWLGTYGCPNHYASLLLMATGASLALGCFSKLAWPLRIVFFYLAGVIVIGVLYSGSRGSWLAFIVMIMALTVFGLRNGTVRWWVPVAGMIALLAAAGFAFSKSGAPQHRLNQLQTKIANGGLGSEVRVELAIDALRIARDHPAFGTGPATFVFIHPRYQSNTFQYKAVLTHDDYLNCLADYGLVGFGLAMFFLWAVTLKFLRPLRADNRWQDRVVVAGGIAAWAALVVHSATDFNLHIPANALLFFALIGLAVGRMKDSHAEWHWSSVSLGPLGRGLGWAVVVLSIGYGLCVGRTALGAIAYDRASADSRVVPTEQSLASAEGALKQDPTNAQTLVLLGDLHRYTASREQEIAGRVEEGQKALAYYQKALKANPLDDTIQGRMGMTFDVMRRYPEAFFCYTQAVTAQPNNGQFWYSLGNHYWQRGMLMKAEQAYLRAQRCPHGQAGSTQAILELRALPGMQDIPAEELEADPLALPASDTEHAPSLP